MILYLELFKGESKGIGLLYLDLLLGECKLNVFVCWAGEWEWVEKLPFLVSLEKKKAHYKLKVRIIISIYCSRHCKFDGNIYKHTFL